ncbi:MAG: glycosyltransferase [Anaerolineae bacterium]
MSATSSEDSSPCHVLEVVGNAVVGGMERHVQLLTQRLVQLGFRITAICPFESGFTQALRSNDCRVHITMLEEALEWRSLLMAAECIRRQQVQLVHCHLFNATLLGSLAGALAGVPVVVTEHGMNLSPELVALLRLTGGHLITVCTAAQVLGLALGLSEEQMSLIPNGVDTEHFRPDTHGGAFRARLQVPPDVPLVGMVARLSREKGPDLFVHAASMVAAVRPDAHFCLVGEGPLRAELLHTIRGLGLERRIHLVGLMADTRPVYPALDVVCLASRQEGQPLTLLEAMACGRPVAATSVGGTPELVQMGETGWLVAQGDMRGMAERILWLLDNPARAIEMGRAGRQRVVEHFDVRTQASAVGRLFRRLVESRRPQAVTTLRLEKTVSPSRVS